MADQAADLLDLVKAAGWPYRRQKNRGHYLVLPPGLNQGITIATGGHDNRARANGLANLRRAGLDAALAQQQAARDRARRQAQQRQDQRLAQLQAQADRLTQEHEHHELMALSHEVIRRYGSADGGSDMTLHAQEVTDLDPMQLLTPVEVADALGVTPSRVHQLIGQGRLRATGAQAGRAVRYQVAWSDVMDFVSLNG